MLSSRRIDDPITRSENLTIQEVVALLNSRKGQQVHVQRWVCEVCGMVHTTIAPAACEGSKMVSERYRTQGYPEVPMD
jgi:rubrerythrin